SQSLVFGSSLVFRLPLSAPIFSVADADARVVITAGKLHRDWGDGAAAAITQVAAACVGRS
ncbi:MAG TPA: hypothetical protein VFV70_08625, partial [Hyphomonadaceae bacterium]|nr:hypothetical protein [Hyphomonadaceae bacterium]